MHDIVIWITISVSIGTAVILGLLRFYISEKEYKERMKHYEEMHQKLYEIDHKNKIDYGEYDYTEIVDVEEKE